MLRRYLYFPVYGLAVVSTCLPQFVLAQTTIPVVQKQSAAKNKKQNVANSSLVEVQPLTFTVSPKSPDALMAVSRKFAQSQVRNVTQTATIPPDVYKSVRTDVTQLPEPSSPQEPARRKANEDDPYAPLGIDTGGLTLFPSIEQSGGYDTNPNRRSFGAKGSGVSRTIGEVGLQSDWVRHELTGVLRGGYSAFTENSDANRPDAQGRVNLRLDASRDTKINMEGRFNLDTQRPGSPDLTSSVRNRPVIAQTGISVGATHNFNRLSVGIQGDIDRSTYEDAKLNNGLSLNQSDRNFTQYQMRLRSGYELTPGFKPFVEAALDTRVHDNRFDRNGFERDSQGVTARTGTSLEFTRTLTGEVSAGYQVRDYEDQRLQELNGAVFDASLVWSASPLTSVRLKAGSTLDETSIINSSGAVVRQANLEIKHDFQRNLSVTAAAGLYKTDYQGINLTEDAFIGALKLDYRLTRSVAVKASFSHERLKSTQAGADYTANVFLLGLKLQP